MKKTLTTILICLSLGAMAQKRDTVRTDTTYVLKGDRNLTLLYNLLQAGYNGVATSDNFSKLQVRQYEAAFKHIDSLFRPQVEKWHAVKGVKK